MVDNKKKVVSGVVAATALTGAFVAPATAQAADNDTPNSIQETIKEATEAQQAAKAAPQKVKAAKNTFNKVNTNATRAINGAKNLIKDAQKKVDQAEQKVEAAKEDWDTKVVTAAAKAEKAEKETNANRKRRLTNQAKKAKADAEKARQTYENKQSELGKQQQLLEQRESNLLTVQTEENAKVKAAQQAYDQAQADQQKAIQMASSTKKAANNAWGDWDKEHTVEDYSTDISGFQNLIDDYFQPLVQKERLAIGAQQVQAQRLDANRLFLKHDHEMRVWFINEGAGYRNQLAYEATKGDDYQKGMIFDDVSCTTGCQLSNGKNAPLDIGDFVDLGLIEGGTQLNFLLKADGASAKTRNGDVYGADESLNRDGLQHLMAFEVNAGGRDYLMMGFEDLRNGGDLDYNDAVFVVDFGEGNLTDTSTKFAQAATVPEASNIAAIFGVTGAGLMLRRRRRNKK